MNNYKFLLSLKKYKKMNVKDIKIYMSSYVFNIYKNNNFNAKDKNRVKYIFSQHINQKIKFLNKNIYLDTMTLQELHKRGINMNWYDNYSINLDNKKKMLKFLLYLKGFKNLKNEEILNILKNNYLLNILCWDEKRFREFFKQKY